ncbi:AraC family transcriptional regulator [Aquabacterium sp.]|uniref:helix-turn-helix transcriptional regulator n=1 Tax=Aquabacterium sp. TaxID=1872578 RepID=UPI0024895CAB|nr:AraC family transcriptional regulator [Aquabacterium sp.]MDI1260985.1 helix-turn-helix domain-containing protein [Aquabacterium sp.]
MLDTSRHGNPVSDMPFIAANAWIKAATHCRFNIDPLFSEAGVVLGAANHASMVRRQGLPRLMQQCVAHAAPNYHFPLVLGELFAFDHLPALETFLATSPTLRQALPALQWAGMTMPNIALRVEETGPQSVLLLDIDLYDGDPVVRGYFVESVLAAISKIVRLALGHTDLIHHIDMRHQPNALFIAQASTLPAAVRPLQARDAAVFATRLLDMPLPGAAPGLHQRAQTLLNQQLPATPSGLVSQIEVHFKQAPALLSQGIERMAERLDLHPRTLQRRLRDEGRAYTDIQAGCRLDMAKAALQGHHCHIESLSTELGFADRHSFTRAFRRWTGLSPSAFRQSQGQGALPEPGDTP